MAKIGTAHIEIKPVIDEAALSAITDRITQAVADGVARGMAESRKPLTVTINPSAIAGQIYNGLCTCPKQTGPHPFHSSTGIS